MKVSTLNQTAPGRDLARLCRLRALYEGGPAWREHISTWFPPRPMEPADVYEERKQLLTYTNHVGGIVSTLIGLLFSEAPIVEGVKGDYYDHLLADADGAGTSWADWWPAIVEDALVCREGWVWVNLPPPAGQPLASLGEETKAGRLDAWLVRILPEQVLDFGLDDRGALTWVIFRSVNSTRSGPEAERQCVHRWTYLDQAAIRRWEWTARKDQTEPGAEDEAIELPPVLHGLGQVPLVRLELPVSLWGMHRLEDPAVKLLRAECELSWALHQAANELLTLTSRDWEAAAPSLGHGHYLRLARDADGKDEAAYAAPSGMAFEHLRAERDADRDDLYRSFQAMAQAVTPEKQAPTSGASKEADWKAAEVILSSIAGRVTDAMAKVLDRIIALRGDGLTPSVRGLNGWQNEDTDAWLASAAMATDALDLSPTFRRQIAIRQAERLLQGQVDAETIEAIRKEIEEAPEAEAPRYTPPPAFNAAPGGSPPQR